MVGAGEEYGSVGGHVIAINNKGITIQRHFDCEYEKKSYSFVVATAEAVAYTQ